MLASVNSMWEAVPSGDLFLEARFATHLSIVQNQMVVGEDLHSSSTL